MAAQNTPLIESESYKSKIHSWLIDFNEQGLVDVRGEVAFKG